MQTSVPGILAAGDATAGGYNSFSRAVSQGMMAGLSAYAYVYRMKLGVSPSLFAYRPTDFSLTEDYRELPVFDPKLRPFMLGDEKTIRAELGDNGGWLAEQLDGKKSMETMAEEQDIPVEKLRQILQGLVEKKLLTFHVDLMA
jgi:alkyl hydroperoxide reductase subunit AhpF